MTVRNALATGVLMVGLAFVPLGCENPNRPMFLHVHSLPETPDSRQIPEPVLRQLEDCARMLPVAEPSEKDVHHLLGFGVRVDEDGQAGAVTLGRSTLNDHGVEACMAGALHGMTLPLDQLGTLIGEGGGKHPVSPEVRGLLADDPQESLQLLPAAVSVAGRVILVVVVIWAVYEIAKAVLAPAKATSAAAPRAAAPPKARKYPNQTCEDEELAKLDARKDELCKDGFDLNCRGNPKDPENQTKLDNIPCSEVMRTLQERLDCYFQRMLIEDLCFGGIPDKGHKVQIDGLKNGIEHCAKLKATNCAEGHPMSGL